MAGRGSRITTGIAGEHFVAGELSKRGWIVGLTAKNTAQVDLLAKKPSSRSAIAIQVKSRTTAYRLAWRTGPPDGPDDADFYVFVDLGETDEAPQFWIVAAEEVATLRRSEQIRTKDIERFKGRWDQLEGMISKRGA